MNFVVALLLLVVCTTFSKEISVSFDGRSFSIDGQRTLFISGSVHYPRAPRSEWSKILSEAVANGINIIQTYVFWDIHEPADNEWNFPVSPSSTSDLVAFVQEAAKVGLLVHLRISGYICAEWNFGGMPVWLRNLNTTLRTYDESWLIELKQFVEKTVTVVKDAQLLAGDGGPIVMMQIENEYGNMEDYYGKNGHKYVKHIAQYALSLDVGDVAWIMCQQGEGVGTAPPEQVINTCNGFYCDNWISKHAADFPNQPHMFTENWPGWFQNWGEPIPHRPAVDVAFSVARWFARGGSYMNYYMAFGGTNFGRSVGGPLIVTSYDYDVQINEYSMRAEPKFSLLAQLHEILLGSASALLSQAPPKAEVLPGTASCEKHAYRNPSDSSQCITFLSNWGERSSCIFSVNAEKVEVPAWSVSILTGSNCTEVVYNTKTSALKAEPENHQRATATETEFSAFETFPEIVPSLLKPDAKISAPVVESSSPLEQLSLTSDKTDYLWYSTEIPSDWKAQVSGVMGAGSRDAVLSFRSGTAGGGVFFIYVDGVFVGSTLGPAGGPPVNAQATSSALAAIRTAHSQSATPAPLSAEVLAAAASRVESAAAVLRAGESNAVSVNISIPTAAKSLDILSISMGLQNYGPFLELIEVGVVSEMTLDGVVLKNFRHSVGLQGEVSEIPRRSASAAPVAGPSSAAQGCTGLCWHVASFATPADVTAVSALALDLGSAMGKGAVWVNGNMLGRYWNISAVATPSQFGCRDACASSAYVGAYWGDRCRTGCGEPSQRYYKLPAEWLKTPTSGEKNVIVLFEELGGNPAAIKLVKMDMAIKA